MIHDITTWIQIKNHVETHLRYGETRCPTVKKMVQFTKETFPDLTIGAKPCCKVSIFDSEKKSIYHMWRSSANWDFASWIYYECKRRGIFIP